MIKQLSPADQVILSVGNVFKAFKLISKARLNWVFLTPFVVYLIILIAGFSLTNDIHDKLMLLFKSWTGKMEESDGLLSFLFTATSFLTWFIIKITLFIVFGIFSGYITLIVLSPLLTYVTEKVDEEISGVKHPFNLAKFLRDVLRAIYIALRNASVQLFWTVLLMLLSLIPGINLFTAPLLFVITAYFYGFSFIDYSLEIKGLQIKESIQQVKRLRLAAVSLGSMFLILTLIPWFGTFLSTFFIFPLVTSATMLMDKAKAEELPSAEDLLE